MSLAQDQDLLIYKLRLGLLNTRESVAQRIVTMPKKDEYEYISAMIPRMAACAAVQDDTGGSTYGLFRPQNGPRRKTMHFQEASGPDHEHIGSTTISSHADLTKRSNGSLGTIFQGGNSTASRGASVAMGSFARLTDDPQYQRSAIEGSTSSAVAQRGLVKLLDSILRPCQTSSAATTTAIPSNAPSSRNPLAPTALQTILHTTSENFKGLATSHKNLHQVNHVESTPSVIQNFNIKSTTTNSDTLPVGSTTSVPVVPSTRVTTKFPCPPSPVAAGLSEASVPKPPATHATERVYDRRNVHTDGVRGNFQRNASSSFSKDELKKSVPKVPATLRSPPAKDQAIHCNFPERQSHQRSNSEPGNVRTVQPLPHCRSFNNEIPEENMGGLDNSPDRADSVKAESTPQSYPVSVEPSELILEDQIHDISFEAIEDQLSAENDSTEFEEQGIDLDAVKLVVVHNKTDAPSLDVNSEQTNTHKTTSYPAGVTSTSTAKSIPLDATVAQVMPTPNPVTTSTDQLKGAQSEAQVAASIVSVDKSDEHFNPLLGAATTSQSMFTKQSLSPTKITQFSYGSQLSIGSSDLLDYTAQLHEQKHISALSAMMDKKSSKINPFAQTYAIFSGKSDGNPMRLQMFLPFSQDPLKPLFVSVKQDASVEEVIGYTLFEYFDAARQPILPESAWLISNWNLRIVEDDGTIDDDFPALDRARKIQKFAFDRFALCETIPIEVVNPNTQAHGTPMVSHSQAEDVNSSAGIETVSGSASTAATVYLKVHLYSTLEVKQTTTMQMPVNIPMSEVFDLICRKRKYDPKDYVLKMADTKTDVQLDKTLAQLEAIEFCVLKRSSGGAGDIFLRPPDEPMDEDADDRLFLTTEDLRSVYKQYSVIYKHLMGRHERNLTIDGEYIHLVASEGKALFDMGKTTNSFHVSAVVSCKQIKKKSANFKLIVRRNHDAKVYDLEAVSDADARNICMRVTAMHQLIQISSGIENS
ncbi:Component of a membrane-bound complex containing the Tor2p kinase [Batrachochytrium dendrobatidis]|nr:Component of a membrane-bound complex containing the Tor2p kinase [Batrachochytrium dendrobatidis]